MLWRRRTYSVSIVWIVERAEAFARLDLAPTASAGDVETAWRLAARLFHPADGKFPDLERFLTLQEARTVALEHVASPGTEVVRRQGTSLDVLSTPTGLASEQQEGAKVMKSLVLHHVGALAAIRRKKALTGGISATVGALALLVATLRDWGATAKDWLLVLPGVAVGAADVALVVGVSGASLVAFGALQGVRFANLSHRERIVELELHDLGETLSDRSTIDGVFSEIAVGSFFNRDELIRAVESWQQDADPTEWRRKGPRWMSLIRRFLGGVSLRRGPGLGHAFLKPRSLRASSIAVGAVDFSTLLVAKSLDAEMIEPVKRTSSTGERRYGFART